jgi:dynein heavy chain
MDELNSWHKQLQTVEAVLRLWLQVQTLWIQLEEVLSSAESAQHLPTVHYNFSTVDKEWKQLLKNTVKSPNVISTCLQEELISTLDKFRATLNLCKYALLQYIEGRRIKCPWLFFIPLDDILHLVCYGSSLSVFCEILPKLICYSTGVTFNSLNNSCHSITNILSSSGNQLKLIETIECDGPVEGILNHLFYSISESLKHQLDYCLTKHGSLGGIVNGLVSIWGSNLTHQIIQLATFIIVHKQINKALNEKRQSPLELVQSLIHSLCDLSQGRSLSDVDVMSADDAINSGTDGSTVFLYGTNSHHLSYNGINISDHNKSHSVFTDHQHSLYQNLMLYLLNFQELLQEIMSEPNPLSSFKWQSVINYCYSKESCTLQSIGVTLDYGFHFTNGAPFSLSLPNEKLMLYLLQVMKQHYNGLIIANHQKVSSNVSGISVSCGYSLYPIICSSLTLHEVLINFFKGIASTGSWVYLHHFQQLTRQLMQATVEILEIIREAKVKSTCMDIKIGPGDSLKFYKLDTAFCIASTISALPLSVSKIFKSYSLNNSSVSMVIEAMLIVRGFTNVRTISQFLIRYIEESSICHLDIELIINHSAYLVHDFNNTGNESASIHITRNVHSVIAFQVISQQLSNMSLHTSTMLNQSSEQQFDKFTVVNKDHESCGEYANNNFSMKQWYLECLSMLITMWKLNLTIPYMLFEEFFPKLDVLLIVKELEKTQQEIGSQVNWSRNDIESVQVSKASDIFQIAKYKKDSQYLEDIIIQSCLAKGQLPTTDLQKFVHGLTIRLLEQKIIVVSSYWKTGKKECIDISVDVLNKIGYCPTLTSIPIDTMDITSIFGNNKKISIFSQVFSDIYLSHASHHIVVIEGLPCEELASCLEWIGNNSGNTIFFPNLTSYFIHPSVKFVISISSISAKLSFPCLFLDHNISWKSLSQNSFLQLDKGIHEHLDVLCHSFLPALIDFFAPILDKSDIVGGNDGCVLSPQHLKFHQLQLVNSMCLVLKCLLSDVQFSSADIVTNSFVYTLIWTFGSCLNKRNREFFDNWMRGTFPDILNSLTGYLWHYKLSSSFQFELCHAKVDSSYVFTSRTAAASEFVKLLFTKNAHLMLDGPCGSGKTQFLLSTVNSCLQQFSNDAVYSLMHTYVTQVSSPTSFWSQLQENIKWHSGNMYIPQESSRLLALIDDVHLSQNNGYGDIISLIAHHIHNGTILDPFSFNDHIVGGVTYIFTTDSNQAILPNDFLGDVVYLFWEDYSSSELIFIYTTLLNNHFKQSYELTTVIQFVVEAAIHIHFKLLTLFSNTKERMHYQFDINILNKIMKFLTIKLSGSASKEELLKCWLYESYWNYCVQLASVVDKERYQECVINALKKYFSESRLLPKLIEQVFFLSSHEIEDINCITMNDILTNVQREMDLITGCPFISLYNTTLTLSTYISQLLQAPHCLSSLLLIGMGHIEPLLVLIASSRGFTLQRPSQVVCSSKAILSNYNSSQFKSALKTIFINASVKNECYIVFLDHQEIPNVDYLPYVYQFVKDCSLTVEFTNEERLCVINSLRSEITQCGFKYSEKIAWQFFINRLKSNVRFLLSMPDLNFIHECGIVKFRNLLNVVGVYCQLPWSRKDLLHVTDFHLKHCSLPASLHESTCHLLSSIHLSLRDKIFCANSLICLFNDQFEYFVKRFCYDLQNWQDNLFNDNQQLNIAINTFSKAEERLQFLNEKVQREKMILDEKEKSYHQLLIQIGQDNAIAREQNKLVKKQVERIEHLQLVLPEYEHVHSLYLEDLNRIEYETKNVARHLDHQSLLELRSLTKPPVEIQELLEAVIIIIKSPSADLSWTKGAKRLMANIDRFSEMLMEFSACQEISEILLDSLQPYILKPKFNEEFLGKFYFAAGQLCCWVKGVESYHRMLQDNIRRLELRKSTVKASLQEYSEKLYQLQRKVQILEERLQGLSLSLEQSSIEKTQQNIVLSKTIEQLNEQRQFIESLKILNSSWINKKNMFLNDINDKIGQIALSSTMVTYLVSLEPQTIVLAFKDAIEPFIGENLLFINSTKFSNGLLSILNSNQDFSELASLLLNREPQETHLQQSAADVLFTSSMNIDVLKHVIVTVLLTLNPNECLNLGNNNLCQLLLEVLNHPWNKWSLVYDPQCILPCILIDEWTVLNAKDISTTLIHDLEQGLIEGKKIMLSDVKLPIHPVLIPVVQAGFVWNRIDKKSLFVEMCGRRINVNLDFKLIITTENQYLPTDNPMFQSLVCSFSIINMKPSVPLVNAFLTRNSIADVPPINLMSLHSQAKELGNKLMKYLQQANDGIVDQDIVSHVDDLMKLFSKLQQKFQLQLRLLKEHSQQIKHVKPITLFASVVFVLLQTLSNAFQHLTFVWKDYTVLIQKLLDETKEYGEFRNKLFSSIIMKASRYTDRNSLRIVASCLYAVSLWDTSQPLTNLVVKQLLFIVYNEFSNQVNDFTFEIPDYIPHNIAGKVLSLPISVTFLDSIIFSMQVKQVEWENILKDMLPHQVPWKEQISEATQSEYTLEDLVTLSAVTSTAALSYITSKIFEYIQSSPVYTIMSTLFSTDKSHLPICVLHNPNDLISQGNSAHLINMLQHFLNEKGFSSISMSLGLQTESDLLSILSETNADCVCIQNIHLGSSAWLSNVSLLIEKLAARNKLVILLGIEQELTLPIHLNNQCSFISLSVLSPNEICQLPMLVCTFNPYQYLQTLLVIFYFFPQNLLLELDKIPSEKRPLIFLLSAFHAHVYCNHTSAQLLDLVYCLNHLVALSDLPILMLMLVIQSILVKLYSGTDDTITMYFCEENLINNSSINVDDRLTLPIPSITISPFNYADHIVGILKGFQVDLNTYDNFGTDKSKLSQLLLNVLSQC